ncbi:hypothetical protein B0H66DRAFT_631450, partial [Apodospora peruviana]
VPACSPPISPSSLQQLQINNHGFNSKLSQEDGANDVQPDKKSRRQKKKKHDDFPPDEPSLIRLKELERMAQTIVDHAHPDGVPEAPINMLRHVVSLRKRSAKFFHAAGLKSKDDRLKRSNATHSHMINILDRMLAKFDQLLAKASPKHQGSETKDDADIVAVDDLTNMSSYLGVYGVYGCRGAAADGDSDDADADSLSRTTTNQSKRSQKAKLKKKKSRAVTKPEAMTEWIDDVDFMTNYTMDMEDEDDDPFDPYMLIYCLFKDFTRSKITSWSGGATTITMNNRRRSTAWPCSPTRPSSCFTSSSKTWRSCWATSTST